MSCFTFLKVMMVLFNLAIVTMGNAYIGQQRYRKMLKNIISFCAGDGNAQRKYFNSAKQEWNDPPICSHFLLGGGALLGTGIWVAVDRSSFIDVFGALSSSVLQIVNVGYVLIAIGAVLFLLGFLGCCGAQKESKCLLIMFFSIVLIIFIVEIAVAVLALVYTSLAETLLQGTVTQSLKNDFGKPNSEVTTIWNTTMHNLKCCGLSNFTDFNDSYYYNTNKEYPGICCNSLPVPCTYEIALSSNKTGCFPQLLSEVRSHAGAVGGVAAGICALEIAAMAVAMYLYCHLDEK